MAVIVNACRRQARLLDMLACLIAAGVLIAACLLPAGEAHAGDLCVRIVQPQAGALAARIADLACRENALWYEPFIDRDGRLASMTVAEAETTRLHDGLTPAWKRVADYWRGSGLLGQMASFPGASECAYASNEGYPSPVCRAFLIDRPWSAAFVSWAMLQAGVPGFNPSPSHIDYVRDAYLHPDTSPFRFTDPDSERPAPGDLMCFVRDSDSIDGFNGLRNLISADSTAALGMHCDIVIAASPGGDGKLYEVGGNVLQGVTLRILALNRNGKLWALPRGSNAGCGPDNPSICNLNRQNWAVLLKLKPLQPLFVPPSLMQPVPMPQQCCINCVVGSGVPRCPVHTQMQQ